MKKSINDRTLLRMDLFEDYQHDKADNKGKIEAKKYLLLYNVYSDIIRYFVTATDNNIKNKDDKYFLWENEIKNKRMKFKEYVDIDSIRGALASLYITKEEGNKLINDNSVNLDIE